jgi:hypothetical protein
VEGARFEKCALSPLLLSSTWTNVEVKVNVGACRSGRFDAPRRGRFAVR